MESDVILAATITLLILVGMIIFFFVIFQSKKNKYLLEKEEAEKRFAREIEKTQTEIREQSFKNVSWELHDNVGQLLSIAKMQLGILKPQLASKQQVAIEEANKLIGESLQEIRSLSKTLNAEVISNIGIVSSIQLELERFNRLNFLNASLEVKGEEIKLDQKDEIIIFRIIQEFFANVIKHSQADTLDVFMDFRESVLHIDVKDNGIGFNIEEAPAGSGLLNMRSRARLIGMQYTIFSEKGGGVHLVLEYPYKK